MYFIGYSKWLLLCSRLVAGETLTPTHKFVFLSLFHVLISIIYVARLLKWPFTVSELGYNVPFLIHV